MYHVRTSHSFMHKAIIDVVVNTVFHKDTKCNPKKDQSNNSTSTHKKIAILGQC